MEKQDISDLVANYTVGEAVTYDQMMQIKAQDAATSGDQMEEMIGGLNKEEKNPYLFDDTPVDNHDICIVSLLSDKLNQKHRSGKTFLKVKAACTGMDDANKMKHLVQDETCDLYFFGLYKFCYVPCTQDFCAIDPDDRDAMLNDALENYKRHRLKSAIEYEQRKTRMMDDMKRQEENKAKFREGLISENELDSASIEPEPIEPEKPGQAYTDVVLSNDHQVIKSDKHLNDFKFSVIAIVDLADVPNVNEVLKDGCIIKICAVFRQEDEAHKHADKLRKLQRYKHIDLYVCCMYEWLEMPPDQAKLESIHYKQDKLTEALGSRGSDQPSAMDVLESMTDQGS